jgi:tRNA synthetases class I (W and Y)
MSILPNAVALGGSSLSSSQKRHEMKLLAMLLFHAALTTTVRSFHMVKNAGRWAYSASTATNRIEETASAVAGATDSSIYAQQADELAKIKSPFLQTLRDRGFLHQCTNIRELDQKLESGTQLAYLGFDATADSLHVGSLLQIMVLRHFQKSGHRPVVLVGGGTSKVGDPTGKRRATSDGKHDYCFI